MNRRQRWIAVAIAGLFLNGCSAKEPADYTFAPIYAYTTCTAKARAGLDASKVSAEQAARIVDVCDAELQTAAQAMAYRRMYEGPIVEGKNLTATQHFVAERNALRDVAMCSGSIKVSQQLCPRID